MMPGVQALTIDDTAIAESQNVALNRGFFITKKVAFAGLTLIVLAFLAVILGLSLGLTSSSVSDKNTQTGAQTNDYCTQKLCENPNYFNTFTDNKCPTSKTTLTSTTTRTTTTTSTTSTSTTTTTTTTTSTSTVVLTTSALTTEPPKINYRLPTNLVPHHYELTVYVQFDELTSDNKSFPFDGFVRIHFSCVKDTNILILHINNLEIDNSLLSLQQVDDVSFNVTNFTWTKDEERQFLVASLPKTLKEGKNYTVGINYRGFLQDDNTAFYRSSYLTKDGKRRWLLASQMEPTDARKSFPCFDEPALKASFEIAVIHPADYHAISNMPAISTSAAPNGKRLTKFEVSPRMSTYLVGLVVSDFTCINTTAQVPQSISIRVCARPGVEDQLTYARDVGKQVIEFFYKFYGVEYPLPKCDHIAIPDFAAGAMENWGIITYRESRLLYIEGETSQTAEQSIAAVISHELAHMWFGDIVSPEWWNDLWLNEGFARFMEYVGTNHSKPGWDMYEQLTNLLLSILQVDSVGTSHAISIDVNKPEEINEIFDDITYGKGGSVIRMLNYIIGESTFNRGIKNYLNKYKYGNARQEDLWETLGEQAKNESKIPGLDLAEVMSTWTRQMGHPVIHVKRVGNQEIRITQEHFLLDPSVGPTEPSTYEYKWNVPFTYSIETFDVKNNATFSLDMDNLFEHIQWLYQNQTTRVLTLTRPLNDDDFILGNLEVSGFYRVSYEESNWNLIIKQLNKNKNFIPTRTRAQLINDAFGSAQAGNLSVVKPFEVIKYLSEETEWLPWRSTLNRVGYYVDMLDLTGAYGDFNAYLSKLIEPIYKKLSWQESENDKWLEKSLRTATLSFACARDLPDCVSKANDLYRKWMADETNTKIIPASYRSLVICTAIRHGGLKEWEFASKQYTLEKDANKKNDLQAGMACTKEAWLIKRFLEDQLDEKKVRPQDTLTGIRAAAVKSSANAIVWNFIKQNWNELFRRYGQGLSFARLISDVASKFNTKSQLDDFVGFFAQNTNQGSATREVKISTDKVKANVKWMTQNYETIRNWLKDNEVDQIDNVNYRLPTDLKPYYYDLDFKFYYNNSVIVEKYDATVKIHVSCQQDTIQVVLHIKNIDINNSTLQVRDLNDASFTLKNLKWSNDFKREFMIIELSETLRKGRNYSIEMSFNGYLLDDNVGFYKSSYKTNNNETRWLLASQMQPTDARKAFPCFDEPAMKAVFHVRVTNPKEYHAQFNMPVKSRNETGDIAVTQFDDTVVMSSYLVALVVSDFECKNGSAKAGVSGTVAVSVCGRSNAINQLDYALSIAINVLEYFESVYKVKYPLPKCDHVAIPDFNAGAMENWGLITYRESILFFENATTSQSAQQFTVVVIAHELAHMWFGDIVSPLWWNDLWLNEGFATYMEYLGTDHHEKQFKMMEQFVEEVFDIQQVDSVGTSHAISVEVNNPDEINEIFDDISYGKGGSLIRMMNYFMGNDCFQKGITNYLEEYKYSNAEQDNLWNELYKQAVEDNRWTLEGINLTTVMNTWTRQMGHPVITVERINATTLKLTQKHFLLDPNSKPVEESEYNYRWYVPYTHTIQRLGSQTQEQFNVSMSNLYDKTIWMSQNDEITYVSLVKPLEIDEFIIANLDVSGFYRVNYDSANWKLINQQLNERKEAIAVRNRAQLINDAFSLAQANILKTTEPFEVIKYLSKETEYLPWTVTFRRLSYYTNMLEQTAAFGNFQSYLLNLVEPFYNSLGWEDSQTDDWLVRLLRTNVLSFACSRGLKSCVSKAQSLYSQWMSNEKENKIPPNYRSIVYCTAIRMGGFAEWDFASRQYDKEDSASQKRILQSSMSCSKEPWLIKRYLDDQLNGKVRRQDTLSGLSAAASKSYANLLTWNFLKDNWNEIYSRHGEQLSFANFIGSIATKFNTEAQLKDFETFFEGRDKGAAAREVQTSTEKINANIKWMQANYAEINKWLSENSGQVVIVEEKINYRLPTDLIPEHYNLEIQPYIGPDWGNKSFTFDGKVKITFKCVSATDKLVFHIKDLSINNATIKLTSTQDSELSVKIPWSNDYKREFFVANFNQKCKKDVTYELYMEFVGQISSQLAGFYRSSYLDRDTQEIKYLATTHFQPTDARRAFPCFDEPAMKAKFTLTIIRHKNFGRSFGNMPHKTGGFNQTIAEKPDWRRDEFETSVPMSTYLVAFVVSDFDVLSNKSESKQIDVEVAARPSAIADGEGKFALEEAQVILDFFDDYFNVSYPLPKSTQIGVPDFNAGAMENWGLVIYRETALLYNPNRDAIGNKRRVSLVVSHELAHQWFGNLVTPEWWNDIWLNEGFASWVEYLGYNRTHPEWRDLDSFFVQKLNTLVLDSLTTSHPISVEVNDPAEINSIFDTISYDKGSSIIRMMNAFLTEKTFKLGVSNYLNKFAYKNAIQDDLWEELTKQAQIDQTLPSDLTVKNVMDTWTLQMGYPVVTVSRDYANKKATLTQKWFLLNPSSQYLEGTQHWYVPFTYTTAAEPSFDFESKTTWMKPSDTQIVIDLSQIESDDWIIGNLRHVGFYRVNYDKDNWAKLIEQLTTTHDAINEINRASLLDDSFNLGRAGMIDQVFFLNMTKYLKNENDSIPWTAAFAGLNFIGSQLQACNDAGFIAYKNFYRQLLLDRYSNLAWDASILDDASKIDLQLSVMNVMCSYDYEDCVSRAKAYFKDWKDNGKEIPANFKATVYNTAIKNGNEDDWNFLFNRSKVELSSSERLRMLRGLTNTKDFCLLKYILSQTSNKDVVKPQDETSIISAVSSNQAGKALAWDFFVENWNNLLDRYGGVSFTLGSLVTNLLSKFNTEYELQRVQDFMTKYPDQGVASNAFKQSLENINSNIRWMNENAESISNWLTENI